MVVHFEWSEYIGREMAGEESEVEYAVVAEGEFEVNFTVVVETEDASARGNQDTLKRLVCVYCVGVGVSMCVWVLGCGCLHVRMYLGVCTGVCS